MVDTVRMTGWSLLPLAVLLAGVGVAGMSPVSRQPRVVTLSTVSCANCRILAESVAYVGHPLDTISVALTTIPARDSRGRFYAISSAFRQAYAFDSRGRLTHAFGSPGEGPGEFSPAVREIHVGSGDTLYFLERGKVSVFTPDYKVARQLPIASTIVGRLSASIMKDGKHRAPHWAERVHPLSPRWKSLARRRRQAAGCRHEHMPSMRVASSRERK